MAQVQLDGTVTVGPVTSGSTSFPGAINTVSFSTTPTPKAAQVYSSEVRQVSSPSAYAVLSGVGASDNVTKANFLYLKTNAPVLLRTTMVATSPLVAVEWVQGVLIKEYPDGHELYLLEVQGTGTVEYFVSGNQ